MDLAFKHEFKEGIMAEGLPRSTPTPVFDPVLSRQLDVLIIELDKQPPDPAATWLRLSKAELVQQVPPNRKVALP